MRVAELFAGVGGFRLGFDEAGFKTIWANQWEPGMKAQWAADIYETRFGPQPESFNVDIHEVTGDEVPDHDILCGGFPCQDYSVATANARGMEGKKGALWWQILRIVDHKRPTWVVLENVDRLLVSPSKARGRDFAVVLACLRDLGYSVAWSVVNAADHGVPQRRKRVFIIATKQPLTRAVEVLVDALPDDNEHPIEEFVLDASPKEISDSWDGPRFQGRGFMSDATGVVAMRRPSPIRTAEVVTLGQILERGVVGRDLRDLDRWAYLKGSKDEPRQTRGGFSYRYKEGAIAFPDHLDRPARTILTSEGGATPSRSTHVVKDPSTGALRTLDPVEAERIQGFPDGWTEGAPERWRFKLMGNALAVPVVARIGRAIARGGGP